MDELSGYSLHHIKMIFCIAFMLFSIIFRSQFTDALIPSRITGSTPIQSQFTDDTSTQSQIAASTPIQSQFADDTSIQSWISDDAPI